MIQYKHKPQHSCPAGVGSVAVIVGSSDIIQACLADLVLSISSRSSLPFVELVSAHTAFAQTFATVADKQRIEAFLRRGVRLNLYSADDPTVSQCAADADDTLSTAVLANDHHVLRHYYRTAPLTPTVSDLADMTAL